MRHAQKTTYRRISVKCKQRSEYFNVHTAFQSCVYTEHDICFEINYRKPVPTRPHTTPRVKALSLSLTLSY